MTSFFTNCANTIAEKVLDLTISEARYLCCYKCIVEDFEKEKKELKSKLKRLEGDVTEANNRNEVILEDVDFHLKKGHNLIEEDTHKKRTWLFGWCPNCIWQYGRGKELAEKVVEIKNLKAINFKKVGRNRQLPGVVSQDFIQFQSRDLAYQKLLEAFKDENSYMVGLYGMGGIGKTTLVKKVGKEVQESKLFDVVVFTVVSNDPDIRKIQNNIASPLSLKFKEENELEIRAKELLLRLTNGQKILIILDDVWQELKFDEIGIPSEGYHRGCSVLITSRKLSVCNSMNCRETIPLELLSENEARLLFDKHAGLRDDSSKVMKKLAPQIADECKKLPVAIVAVARSLKNQPLKIWEAAFKSLKELKKIGNVDEELMIYRSIELSYKSLRDETAKKLFLLCSLFPEDYAIPGEDLTRYGIGLGLFGDVDSYGAARIDVLLAKQKLLDVGLLLEGEEEGCVKMHDLVRDAAHWISKYEIQAIIGLKMNATVKQITMRYLYCNNLSGFLNQLHCTELEILILLGKKVPTEAFFEGMKNLRVLTLDSGMPRWDGSSRPSIALRLSSDLSKNLRTLRLKCFILDDLSFVGNLQGLETLELEYCSIDELPNGIVNFKKLKLVSLKDCKIERNPYKVISRLSQIEELYFMNNQGWEEKLDSEVVANLFDKYSISPDQLKRYHLGIGQDLDLHDLVDGSTLRAIAINIFDASILNATIKDLVLRAEILDLREMQGDCRSVIPDFVTAIGGSLNELIELKLISCSAINCLFNTTNPLSWEFCNLVKLRLESMDSLEKICCSPPAGSLEKLEEIIVMGCNLLHDRLFVGNWNLGRLKVLCVSHCAMLTSLFTTSTAQTLVMLEKLTVEDCRELKYLIEFEGEEEVGEIVLNDDDQKGYGSMLPNLKTVEIWNCEKLELISTVYSKSRRDMMIDSKGLQMLNSKCLHPFGTIQCLLRQSLILHNMRSMELYNCSKIISLFTLAVAQTMLLEKLSVGKCDSLKCIIIDMGDYHGSMNCVSVFPKLKELSLYDCGQLEFIIGQYHYEDDNHNIEIPIDLLALKETMINNPRNMIRICPVSYCATFISMKEFYLRGSPQFINKSISNFMVGLYARQLDWKSKKDLAEIEKHLTALKYLSVEDSYKIEGIFCLEGVPMIGQEVISSGLKVLRLKYLTEMRYICRGPKHIMYFQNLEILRIKGSKKLEVVLSTSVLRSLPQLRYLHIDRCENLEQIIEEKNTSGSNSVLQQTQACFPRLQSIIVQHCNKLKALFSISTSFEFPELKVLIVNRASQLQKVFETEAHLKVEFPKLKYLTLVKLDSLTDVIELQNVTYRFIHNCPKLSLESTTSGLLDLRQEYMRNEENYLVSKHLYEIFNEITAENPKPVATSLGHEDQHTGALEPSESEVPSSQGSEGNVQDVSISEKAKALPPVSLVTSLKETSGRPQQLVKDDSVNEVEQIPVEQSAPAEKKRTNNTQKVDKHSNLVQNDNFSKETSITTLPVLSTILELKDLLRSPMVMSTEEISALVTEKIDIAILSTDYLKLGNSPLSPPVTSVDKASAQQIEMSQTNFYNGADSEAHSLKFQDFAKVPKPFNGNKDNLLAMDIVADMLEMPLRDIASSKASILRLQTALNFLSCLCVEDGALSDGLKDAVDSLHHDFPAILCLFKEAFATINKFAMLERREKSVKVELAHQKQAALNLVSEISKTKRSLDEALQKKTSLNDQITGLQVELELENVNEEMSRMMEGTKIAWQELFMIDHKWMLLCSQFEQNWRSQKAISSTDHSNSMSSSSVYPLQETSPQEVGDIQDSKPSASINAGSKPIIKDNLVLNVLASLQVSLKMPLKDIANSKDNSFHLQTALKFLSDLSLEDVTLTAELKAIIVSLHHEFPSVLSSFKQGFATIDKYAALEEKEKSIMENFALQKEATITPIPYISKTKRLMNEGDQEKEANLKEHISRLQVELEPKK